MIDISLIWHLHGKPTFVQSQAPSLAMLVFKTADYMPELVEFNALTKDERFGQLLIHSMRAWADGRFNLGDTPEAVDTGEHTGRPSCMHASCKPVRLYYSG